LQNYVLIVWLCWLCWLAFQPSRKWLQWLPEAFDLGQFLASSRCSWLRSWWLLPSIA
jgi:hypothetical protein